ncbi:Fic/DOC family protein [Lederbergia lenta]|uniref:Fic/DOC family protein n=1 Tax=Lederbergia lenta TaxID=1467 RepID=UPI00203B3235|nr:Fic family protein [Lederbergia lenta]MCM3113597.1 Fic family protein [Lederbergia lenta]
MINNFDIKDQKKLDEVEKTLTFQRMSLLYENPIYGAFGLKHLQKIHKYIFQDVYPFAGKIRDEQMTKGNTTFAHPRHLEPYAFDVFKQLKGENYLQGLELDKLNEKASYYLSEINMIHPFREGNGRTQREYIRLLFLKNGYELNLTNISSQEMIKASIRSVNDPTAFVEIFNKHVENREPDEFLIKSYKNLKKNNDLEL